MSEETYSDYLFSYNYEGDSYVFTIKASSPQDAKARVQRLQWATYDGEVKAVIPVPGPLQRIVRWLLGAR